MFKPLKEKHAEVISAKLAPYLPDHHCPMWVLSNKNFQRADIPRILGRLEYIQVETLISTNNNRHTIIAEIAVVCWTQLRVLNLAFNNICSIEPLSTLQADGLASLFIDNNYIVSVRALARVNFPSLSNLSLQNNRVRQLGDLGRSNCPNLVYFNINGNPHIVEATAIIKQNFDLIMKQLNLPFAVKAHRPKWMALYAKKSNQTYQIQ